MNKQPKRLYLLGAALLLLCSCRNGSGLLEDCQNGLDDDLDGAEDCLDTDCSTQAACTELCADGLDNDQDSAIDCADLDCTGDVACQEACQNGLDDDGDGATDCQDQADCAEDPSCQEDCQNGLDDDADGLTDCQDTSCAGSAACPEDCQNGLDDDQDGLTDCQDIDCAAAAICIDSFSGLSQGYFIDSVVFPGDAFAFDLNGDGAPDNGIDDVTQSLLPFDINLEDGYQESITSGAFLTALSVTADDPLDDPLVGVLVFPAQTVSGLPPSFDTNDILERSGLSPDAVYTGASLNAGFLQTGTASFPIGLPFDATGTQPPLLFNLEAARLEGDVLASNILNGRIGGFLRSEVFSQKLPEVAFSLSLFIDQEAANFAASQGAPGPISCVGDSIGVSAACGSTGRCTTTDGQTAGICISRLSDAVSLLLFTDNASSGGNGNGKLDVIDQNGDGRFSPGDGDQNEIGLFFNVDPRGIASGVIGQHFTLDLDGDGDGDALAVAVFFSAVAAVLN